MSTLWSAGSPFCFMSSMWDQQTSGMTKITARDQEILKKIGMLSWMTSDQIHYFFFQDAAVKVATNRLLLLRNAGYVRTLRASRVERNIFCLTSKGKREIR